MGKPQMSSSAKTLETAKKGAKVHRIEIDLDELPEDLAAAYLEKQRPYRHDEKARQRISAGKRAADARRKAEWMARREAAARKGVYDRDLGRGDKILELATDWITAYELRLVMRLYRGAVQRVLSRLWHEGRLLKRKNPAWTGQPGRGVGIARCVYQYKASVQVHDAPQGD